MAVVSVLEMPDGREGTWNRLYQRTYTRTFQVECSDRRDGPYVIRAAMSGGRPLLPRIGNAYYVSGFEYDYGSFASEINTRFTSMTPDGCVWTVTVSYSPYDAAQFGENPTEWPIKVSFGAQKYEVATGVDQAGNAIVNSAGQPFKDPVMLDDSRPVLTVVRNESIASINFLLAEQYRDKVNAALWNGFDPKTVKCTSITTGEPQYDSNNQTWYYAVTYTFEVNRNGWVAKLLDQGLNYLDGSGKLTPFRDTKGQKLDEGKLLDGSGHELTSGAPVFFTYDVYPSADFSAFNIDLNTAIGR